MIYLYDNVIDSREILERISQLTAVLDDPEDIDDWLDAREELHIWQEVIEAIGESTAFDSVTLVRDDYFEEYAQDFAEEIGAVSNFPEWPCDCIDWERAAREHQMDYTAVDIDGTTYWYR